ncbi:MAG: glycoside hydrolase family 16 protein [Lutibacter sp.]|uniref:glycoside hydrolase family 16 protein n=1 Tax=Lutibacter sp. TaxID=1925666 RepID=UPI0017CCE286|nr:glycoside hydrolase family 16 protein [Lutibacter sp.]MBT8316002.1 glycoside hydrolase family 16 protein [Lutibacter sp.]NNJ56862.1 glycoside hydrolase family 16 protein [Lutibacter sp.]
MKKYTVFAFFLLSLSLSTLVLSCSGDSDTDTNVILSLDVSIKGANDSNSYGDGSGVVNFKATATNAVKYGFIIDNQSEQETTNGTYQYTFNDIEGVENHEIKVIAYFSANNSINISKTVAVAFYNGTPPIWADEFVEDGAPNPKNWNYNLGAGGWGNNELQTYTNSSENVIVEDGVLKIIARSDGSGGYTSARIKSENLFEFTYGTVEVRAKLPSAQGTWPAIWMLGANFEQVGWPNCGEIDIMEQTGWDKNKVLATCHWSNNGNYAGYGLETSITNSSSIFHVYKLVWSQGGAIRIFVDDDEYYVMTTDSSMPFNADFFFILNIAMGGNLGGTINPNFIQSTMEIDYVRVYQ